MKFLPIIGIGLTLIIFAAAIFLVSLHLRGQMRQQIINRDAEVLHSVALAYLDQAVSSDGSELENAAKRKGVFTKVLLKTSQMRNVIAARLFTPGSRQITIPEIVVNEIEIPEQDLKILKTLNPIAEYRQNARLDKIFTNYSSYTKASGKDDDPTANLLEVDIPLHRKDGEKLLGVAQLIFGKESLKKEFASLDQHLLRQGGIVFFVGGFIIVVGLGWAFHRLESSNRLLKQRTQDLLHANEELTVAAKSSAVGAITAHLMHDLKNPLFSLQMLANQMAEEDSSETNDKWRTAIDTTKRIQSMVNEVTRVLSDDQSAVKYELSLAELREVIESKVLPLAQESNVRFSSWAAVDGQLSNRTGNLVILILQNLIHNAIQATPEGKEVKMVLINQDDYVAFEVHDEGPGINEAMQETLFTPQRSSKRGSSGIGLAISKQLANHIGAVLELKSTSEQGSVFRLALPESLLLEKQIAFSES